MHLARGSTLTPLLAQAAFGPGSETGFGIERPMAIEINEFRAIVVRTCQPREQGFCARLIERLTHKLCGFAATVVFRLSV